MKATTSVPLQSQQSSPAAVAAVEDPPVAGLFWTVGFWFALAGIFVLYSRFFDLAANGFKIPRIILSFMVLFFLLSGRFMVSLRSSTGKLLVVLVGWVSITMLTSVWKSGSIPPYYQLLQSTLIFAIAAGMPLAVNNVKRIMSVLAIAGLVATLMSIPWGAHPFGRLALAAGSYYDPNYYAMSLIAIVPFFWAMAAATRSWVVKIIAWGSLVPIFLTIARSGSRGAMLGFAVMLLLMFVISNALKKLLIVGVTLVGLVVAAIAMPDYLRARYFTFFEIGSNAAEEFDAPASAAGEVSNLDRLHADASSAQDRKRLLFTSIALTLEHPVFGVGPGNFPTAVYDESKAAGAPHNEWLVTHNSYTEISSETGLPGFILFLAIIVTSFACLISVLKRSKESGEKPDIVAYSTAKYLLLSLACLCVSIFFLAVGYEFTIYLWAGMAVSLRRTFDEQRVVNKEESVQPQRPISEKRSFAPARAENKKPLPQRQVQAVEGRPVRFNRFR